MASLINFAILLVQVGRLDSDDRTIKLVQELSSLATKIDEE